MWVRCRGGPGAPGRSGRPPRDAPRRPHHAVGPLGPRPGRTGRGPGAGRRAGGRAAGGPGVTSTERKAVSTAEPIAERFGVPLLPDRRLVETGRPWVGA